VYQQACFAADTPLLTPTGSKPIDQFRVGDLLVSRSESDPEGPTEIKQVEEVFVRTGRIMDLRVGGRLIRTTAEHPFYVRGRGWQSGGGLQVGDRLSSHDGRWVEVEETSDTGGYETVYNLRVADFHTYFVGRSEWGFSVWAHNSYWETINADIAAEQARQPWNQEWAASRAMIDETISNLAGKALLRARAEAASLGQQAHGSRAETWFYDYLVQVHSALRANESMYNVEWQPAVESSPGGRRISAAASLKTEGSKRLDAALTLLPKSDQALDVRPESLLVDNPSELHHVLVGYDITLNIQKSMSTASDYSAAFARPYRNFLLGPTVKDIRLVGGAIVVNQQNTGVIR
jgi:hypothetical protein